MKETNSYELVSWFQWKKQVKHGKKTINLKFTDLSDSQIKRTTEYKLEFISILKLNAEKQNVFN